MQFCDACGSLMRADDGEMVCAQCGERREKDPERVAEFTTTETQEDAGVIETEEGAADEGKPTAKDVVCDRCGHDRAWYTIKQTASADEPPTRFFKCQECGYRWRGYG